MELSILYQDDYFVAINKPHGLLVHRTPIAADAQVFALQLLREQIGKKVFPVHRLDRKTSGVLLFALSRDALMKMSSQFEERLVLKTYLAIVRGYTQDTGEIDYPLAFFKVL
jgi:tRNA pseudouridine65 synthase